MSDPLIELRLWRQFVAVADELHFGRAAQRLHMTQPPLTQAIALLESRLGAQLFERNKRSVRLTPAGQSLLPQAREVIARAMALPAVARAAAGGDSGRLQLAFVSTVGFDLLPGWVRAFRDRHPGVELDLQEATGDVTLDALNRGDVDAGFVLHSPGFAPPGLLRHRVAAEPLVLALPERHPLAKAEALAASDLDDLLAEPLVLFPRRILPSVYDALFALYHAAGRSPQVAQEAIQMQTIVNLVSAGLGLAWVPQSVTQFQRSGVVYRQAPNPKRRTAARVPECETSLVWPEANANPVLARFIELVKAKAK